MQLNLYSFNCFRAILLVELIKSVYAILLIFCHLIKFLNQVYSKSNLPSNQVDQNKITSSCNHEMFKSSNKDDLFRHQLDFKS